MLFGKIVGVAIQLQKGYIPRKKKGSDRKFLCVACGPVSGVSHTSSFRLVWSGSGCKFRHVVIGDNNEEMGHCISAVPTQDSDALFASSKGDEIKPALFF